MREGGRRGGEAGGIQEKQEPQHLGCWELSRLLLALSGARKYSRSRDPGGRRLESTQNAAYRRARMIVPPTVGPLWLVNIAGDVDVNVVDIIDVVDSCVYVCSVLVSVVYIVV